MIQVVTGHVNRQIMDGYLSTPRKYFDFHILTLDIPAKDIL
jgi:hypothetical protein